MAAQSAVCGHCGRLDPKRICSACATAWYCGVECQRAHWRAEHRQRCARLPEELRGLRFRMHRERSLLCVPLVRDATRLERMDRVDVVDSLQMRHRKPDGRGGPGSLRRLLLQLYGGPDIFLDCVLFSELWRAATVPALLQSDSLVLYLGPGSSKGHKEAMYDGFLRPRERAARLLLSYTGASCSGQALLCAEQADRWVGLSGAHGGPVALTLSEWGDTCQSAAGRFVAQHSDPDAAADAIIAAGGAAADFATSVVAAGDAVNVRVGLKALLVAEFKLLYRAAEMGLYERHQWILEYSPKNEKAHRSVNGEAPHDPV